MSRLWLIMIDEVIAEQFGRRPDVQELTPKGAVALLQEGPVCVRPATGEAVRNHLLTTLQHLVGMAEPINVEFFIISDKPCHEDRVVVAADIEAEEPILLLWHVHAPSRLN